MKTNTFNINIPNRKTVNLARAILLISLFFLAGINPVSAQNVGINTTGATPNSSAILDLTPNTAKGFLPPKVALQATNVAAPITNPSNGLLVYDTVSAGAGATSVTQGYYFWSGTVAAGSWVRIQNSNPNQPYGYNTQYVVGTTDQTTTSTSFTPLSQMTITFTPVHSTVYLTFSASGFTNLTQASIAFVAFEVLKNGAAAATDGYGSISLCQVYNAAAIYASGWSCDINLPISVTAGTSVTISIDWEAITENLFFTPCTVENYVSTNASFCHRTMFIND